MAENTGKSLEAEVEKAPEAGTPEKKLQEAIKRKVKPPEVRAPEKKPQEAIKRKVRAPGAGQRKGEAPKAGAE